MSNPANDVRSGIIVCVVLNRRNEKTYATENTSYLFLYTGDKRKQELEEEVREIAQEFLKGSRGDNAITQSCHNFNWGDFFTSLIDEDMERHGFYEILHEHFIKEPTPVLLSGFAEISFEHDETILQSDVFATLHIVNGDGTESICSVDVDMYSGCVEAEDLEMFDDIPDGREVYIDFGNGVKHPVSMEEHMPYSIAYHFVQ